MALSSRIHVGVQSTQRASLDLTSASAPLSIDHNLLLHNGTGAGQADVLFSDRRTIAASGTDDVDLNAALTDAFGASISLVRVKALLVSASASNVNNVVVGGAVSNQFASWVGDATDTIVLRPGGVFLLATGAADTTGYGVTAATGDLLRVANSGAGSTVTYDIVLLGCSA